jgi:peptidoglycan/xylan/chitin deacetylase (PgdA/CDA1 family)
MISIMRHWFRKVVQDAALCSGASAWRARSQHARRILTLHGVGAQDMPLERFTTLMRWLRRHARVVPLEGMLASLRAGEPAGPELEVALTFDDGLANQFLLAYPVLRELGLSATIFACPQLIDEGRWLWTHEARARWRRLSPDSRRELADEFAMPDQDTQSVVGWLKSLPSQTREHIFARVREATPDFRPERSESMAYDLMTWEQIRRMDPTCVTIGSHTLSHPILTTLGDQDLERELRDSRSLLETRLDRAVPTLCYPNGSVDARVRDCAARHYEAAMSTCEAFIPEGPVDYWFMPRIALSSELALSVWRLHSPQS